MGGLTLIIRLDLLKQNRGERAPPAKGRRSGACNSSSPLKTNEGENTTTQAREAKKLLHRRGGPMLITHFVRERGNIITHVRTGLIAANSFSLQRKKKQKEKTATTTKRRRGLTLIIRLVCHCKNRTNERAPPPKERRLPHLSLSCARLWWVVSTLLGPFQKVSQHGSLTCDCQSSVSMFFCLWCCCFFVSVCLFSRVFLVVPYCVAVSVCARVCSCVSVSVGLRVSVIVCALSASVWSQECVPVSALPDRRKSTVTQRNGRKAAPKMRGDNQHHPLAE